jgi:hypothetical protein
MEPEIVRAASLAARLMETKLRSQAPVKTGALRDSVKVVPRFTEKSVLLDVVSLDYGKYTDLGTGPYKTPPSKRRSWNKTPGKGKGGIKPRFWTSLTRSFRIQQINSFFNEAIKKIIKRQFTK